VVSMRPRCTGRQQITHHSDPGRLQLPAAARLTDYRNACLTCSIQRTFAPTAFDSCCVANNRHRSASDEGADRIQRKRTRLARLATPAPIPDSKLIGVFRDAHHPRQVASTYRCAHGYSHRRPQSVYYKPEIVRTLPVDEAVDRLWTRWMLDRSAFNNRCNRH